MILKNAKNLNRLHKYREAQLCDYEAKMLDFLITRQFTKLANPRNNSVHQVIATQNCINQRLEALENDRKMPPKLAEKLKVRKHWSQGSRALVNVTRKTIFSDQFC